MRHSAGVNCDRVRENLWRDMKIDEGEVELSDQSFRHCPRDRVDRELLGAICCPKIYPRF